MLYILLLWQFPQTLLSLVLMLILKAKFSHKIGKSNIYLVNGIDGMSLGKFIFINPKCKEGILLRHEYGHTIQSRILGPLYLFLHSFGI